MSCHVNRSSASRVFLAPKCNVVSSRRHLWDATPCCCARAWEALARGGCNDPGTGLGPPHGLHSHSSRSDAPVLSTGAACAEGCSSARGSREPFAVPCWVATATLESLQRPGLTCDHCKPEAGLAAQRRPLPRRSPEVRSTPQRLSPNPLLLPFTVPVREEPQLRLV